MFLFSSKYRPKKSAINIFYLKHRLVNLLLKILLLFSIEYTPKKSTINFFNLKHRFVNLLLKIGFYLALNVCQTNMLWIVSKTYRIVKNIAYFRVLIYKIIFVHYILSKIQEIWLLKIKILYFFEMLKKLHTFRAFLTDFKPNYISCCSFYVNSILHKIKDIFIQDQKYKIFFD